MPKKSKKAGSRGAISVFLAIILVPCIVFTCIFGDLSRVQLSMAAAESSGDLALYSLMAHYDEKLKEYYGLVASCQDIDDFYDKTATYFTGMMQAEGISGEGSQIFLEYLRALQNQDLTDFLRVEFVEPAKVEAPTDGALGNNPALIEDGIVEFMKYRGPIQLTTKLLDRLSSLNFEKEINDVEENKEVTDKKQEYAKAQGELLEKAFYTYLAIRQYEKKQESDDRPSRESYDKLSTDLDNIRDDLRGVTSLVAKYYYPGSEAIHNPVYPQFDTHADDYVFHKEDVGTPMEQDGEALCCIDRQKLDELLQGLDEDIRAIEDAGQVFLDATADIPDPNTGINEVVYCIKMQEAIESCGAYDTMNQKGDSLLKRRGKIDAALECVPKPEGDDLPADWQQQLTSAKEKIDKVDREYLTVKGSSAYWKKLDTYITKAVEVEHKVHNYEYTMSSKFVDKNVRIDELWSKVRETLPKLYDHLEEQVKNLDRAIDGGTLSYNGKDKTVIPMDDLILEARNFTSKREAWGQAAGAHNTDYAKKEYELYQNASAAANGGESDDPEVEGERIAAQITPESVQELKARLSNIRADMKACMQTLEQFTYGGTAAKDLADGNAVIDAARSVMSENREDSLDAAETAAANYFPSLCPVPRDKVYTAPQRNDATTGNDPVLDHATPALYKFLKDQFREREDDIDSEIDANEDRNTAYQNKANGAKTKATSGDNEYMDENSKGTGLGGSDADEKEIVSALDGLGSTVTIANNVMNGRGDELRDQLYVCEYIMDMFSYSTMENEGKYRLTKDTNEGVTYQDYPYNGVGDQWKTVDAKQVMENQTLTNMPFDTKTHKANLGEVEYILYGKGDFEANLSASYSNIFALREILNVVSGFCNFYSAVSGNNTGKTINTIATTVASLTAGIVPVPVTKCVLIGVLATLESAKDMERLKKGGRVELYKASAKQWECSLDGDGPAANFDSPNDDRAGGGESGMYYSDYLYVFLLTGLTNGTTYTPMLQRVGNLIEANMGLVTGKTDGDDKYLLTKSQVYFQLTGTVRVKPLMMTIPLVDTVEGAGEMRERTDWCTYKVNMIRGYS